MKKIIILAIFITGAVYAQEKSPIPSVSVSGEGVVKVMPDRVLLSVRVESQGKSATEVKSQNDVVIDAVLKFCKQMKVDKKDVKTDYINLNKTYDYQTKKYSYVANQSLSILLTDMSLYSTFTQGLLETGINRIDGMEFKISAIETYKAEARKKAVANARQKAQEYAGALSQSIGKAIYISEEAGITPMPVMYRSAGIAETSLAKDSSLETIALGETEIKATIQVVFELK
jgi:uncharacterized protein YggE